MTKKKERKKKGIKEDTTKEAFKMGMLEPLVV